MKQRRQGTIPGNSRLFNLRLVLDMVRLRGPISRADLARRTNLTKQTVGIIADELCQTGLLREEGRKTGGIGKPSMQMALNAEGAFTVGLHLDRDQLTGILCDLTGQVRLRRQHETPTRSPEVAAELLRDLALEILTDSGIDARLVLGIGLVMPGPFGVEQVGPTSLPGWDGPALARTLSGALDLPVLLENDATASAIAESHSGVARAMRNFCLIYLGIGLGVGVVVDGHPYAGATSNAGEFGHLIVQPGGLSCGCGNAGCLERYVSLNAAFESLARNDRRITSIAQFRREVAPGDPDMVAWFDSVREPLRIGINALENLFDPEAIVFGGDAPDWVIDGLMASAEPLLPSVRVRSAEAAPRLRRAATQRDMAVLGAATIVLFDALNPSYKWLFRSAEGTDQAARSGLELLGRR